MLAAITGSDDAPRSQDTSLMHKDKARSFLQGLLNETLSMTVSDGRTFVGVFMCTDRDAAVLLADAWEYRGGKQIVPPDCRG